MEDRIKEIEAWQYLKELPEEIYGFRLCYEQRAQGDAYVIFSYENPARHRKLLVYYHAETKEYKLKTVIGLTEFCNINFIRADLDKMEAILKEGLEDAVKELAFFQREKLDSIVIDKKILEWDYINRLPETIEGFSRFISPSEPVRIINGSYIILDYCDFENESNFIIYYNIFRDEFFGEARIRMIPEMNYVFDAKELDELEEKMELYFSNRLKEIRANLEGQKHDENGVDDCGF